MGPEIWVQARQPGPRSREQSAHAATDFGLTGGSAISRKIREIWKLGFRDFCSNSRRGGLDVTAFFDVAIGRYLGRFGQKQGPNFGLKAARIRNSEPSWRVRQYGSAQNYVQTD